MYPIVEEALAALERAKKLPNIDELVDVARMRYQSALKTTATVC